MFFHANICCGLIPIGSWGSLIPMQADRTVRDTSVSLSVITWDPIPLSVGTLHRPSSQKGSCDFTAHCYDDMILALHYSAAHTTDGQRLLIKIKKSSYRTC